MSKKIPLEQLLHWRLKQAEAAAPPPPKAAQLLQSARPWWKKRPKECRSKIERLRKFQCALSHSSNNKRRKDNGILVPALLVHHEIGSEICASIKHFSVFETNLRLSFSLETKLSLVDHNLEVTFISNATPSPMFDATATISTDNAFHIETILAVKIAKDWEHLKLAYPMPFALIIHSNVEA